MKRMLVYSAVIAVMAVCSCLSASVLDVKVKYWIPDFNADVRVDDGGIRGTTVDIDKDLGIDTDENVFPIEVGLNLGERLRLWFGYTSISLEGSAKVNKTIVFAGETFSINAEIESSVEMSGIEGGIEYAIFSTEKFQAGPFISATYFEGTAEIKDKFSLISAEGELSSVVPSVGGFIRIILIKDKLDIEGRLSGFILDDNTYIDGIVEAKYLLFKNLGVIAGYHDRSVEVEEDDVYVDASLSGFFIGAILSF